ncbi:MAG: signal peptidase I [Lachnospiraceae bacterium]|nr:signal peptidase I [Lachnospiraceae bacterium]
MAEEEKIEEEINEENAEDKKEKTKRSKARSFLWELFTNSLFLLAVLILTLLIVKYVGQRTVVIGQSMERTLFDGDNLIVDKISYRFRDPKRFEVVVFPYAYEEKTYFIKRVIGLPGERVRIEDGTIYINGSPLNENYGAEVIKKPGLAAEEILLGEDEYFVMGDNRNNSKDSRDPSVGNIHKKDLIGRAWLRLFPFDKIGFVKH